VRDSGADFDDLLNAIAIQTLGKYGSFAPIGLALNRVGKIVMVLADEDEADDTIGLIESIRQGFIEGAHKQGYRATALAYEATVTTPDTGRKVDAIAVAVDHRDGSSTVSYFPYDLDGKDVRVDQERAVAERGEGGIFSE
jgi:hypothetical protein